MLRAASRGRHGCLLFAAVLLLLHTNVLGDELVSSTGRSLLWQAASEYTAIGQAQGLSSNITGTTLNLTCPCGYVKGLRIGQLPSSQDVASVGDVRLICTNVSGGADVIIGQGSGDIAGLDYVDATLNGSSGSNQVNFTAGRNNLGGDYVINTIEDSNLLLANGSLINSILASLNNPSYTLTCNTSTDVLVGLEPEFYNYTATPAYLQLIRLRGACASRTAAVCSCPPGQTMDPSDGFCYNCTAGTYKSDYNATGCTLAPLGSYTAAGASTYTTCGMGYIGNSNRTGCLACPGGYWRPGGQASPTNNECLIIPRGFRSRPDVTNPDGGAGATAPCVAGTVSYWAGGVDAGAPNWNDTSAALNVTALRTPPDPSVCEACVGNTYVHLIAQSACIQAKGGYYPTLTAAPTPISWVPTGVVGGTNYSSVLSTGAQPCPALTYRPANDSSATCYNCGPGYNTRSLIGATACTPCVAGYVNPSQTETYNSSFPNATMYNPSAGNTTYYLQPANGALGVAVYCQPCPEDTYQPNAGQTQCAWCPLGSGTYGEGATTCSACSVGSYSPAVDTNCLLADPGYYVNASGASGQSACPRGTYTNNTGMSQCSVCPAGTYAPNPASTFCMPCPGGTYSGPGAAVCSACPAGTYSLHAAAACAPCPPGTYNAMSAQRRCAKAPSGSYAYGYGNTSPRHCPKGTFTQLSGMPSCLKCSVDTYQPMTGMTMCIKCCLGNSFGSTCFLWTRGMTGMGSCFKSRTAA